MVAIPGLSSVWNLHLLICASFLAFGIFSLKRLYIGVFDKMILLFLSVALLSFLINRPIELKTVVVFILPLSSYYLFRLNNIEHSKLLSFLNIASIALLVLFIVDFLSANKLGLNLINYGAFISASEDSGRIVSKMMDYKYNPFLKEKFIRPVGVTLSPQSSSVIYASFSVMYLEVFRTLGKLRYLILSALFFSTIILFNAGTAYLTFFVLFLLFLRKARLIVIAVLTLPVLVYFFSIFLYGQSAAISNLEYLIDGIYNQLVQPIVDNNPEFIRQIIFGRGVGEGKVENFFFEFDYVNLLFRVGVINYILLIVILAFTLRYLWKHKEISYLKYIIIGIIVGSIHYESIFKYPSSWILFAIIGISSNSYLKEKYE